ncbi:serine protease 27-like [Macrosteles quadrilineatus]|uniref:serine protease 27-like n=1 Tax=Macrosteles quadrilineatus TaxID=74068 RepID=UPI0023E103A6|nr:serine protease 27-like [Macrosteles quadrilineatus]
MLCFVFVLVVIGSARSQESFNPRQDDFTFVLVQNLSELGDLSNYFSQNPASQFNPLNQPQLPLQQPVPIPVLQQWPQQPVWVQQPTVVPVIPQRPTQLPQKPPEKPPRPITQPKPANKPPPPPPPPPVSTQTQLPAHLTTHPVSHTPEHTQTQISHKPKPPEDNSTSSGSCGIRGTLYDVRIVGGSDAQPGEFPWQVSLQLQVGGRTRYICGGAVLAAYWVVTAAHCIWELKPEKLSIVAGDHDLYLPEGHEQRAQVARVIVNGYYRDSFTNDIALLQLAAPLKIDGKWIAPICLPEPGTKFLKGDSTVAGWGRLSESGSLPHILQHVTLPILNTKRCHSLYKRAGYSKFTHTCQMCSGFEEGGFDSCQGDSGGPLACTQSDGHYYLCGIVSWGVGCARPKLPGVYTEVSCFTDWIRNIINNGKNVLANAPHVLNLPQQLTSWDKNDKNDLSHLAEEPVIMGAT